jgi:hypothetical protein
MAICEEIMSPLQGPMHSLHNFQEAVLAMCQYYCVHDGQAFYQGSNLPPLFIVWSKTSKCGTCNLVQCCFCIRWLQPTVAREIG